MAQRTWKFSLQRKKYEVQIDHNSFLGKMKIFLDGNLVREITNFFNMSGDYEFDIKGHSGTIIVRPLGNLYEYDFAVDGISTTTGKPLARFEPLPEWRWIFIIACWLIPIISLGGIVPILLGFGGAYTCSIIVKKTSLTVRLRVVLCVVITILVWAVFLGFAIWSSFQRLGIQPF